MKKYRTILADPPWPMPDTGKRSPAASDNLGRHIAKSGKIVDGKWWSRFTNKSVKIKYPTMSIDEIASMQVSEIADKNAHLYLWTVNRHIEDAYRVARSWGFKPSTMLIWGKTPMGIGFGGTYCNSAEFCLFCRRGTLNAKKRIDSTWWHWSRPYINGHIAHSKKPDEFIDMISKVSPEPRIELFARPRTPLFQAWPGWDVWGNEVESDESITKALTGQAG